MRSPEFKIDMKKKNRDNFSNAMIKTLERQVNAKCSNPDCRVPTSGPTMRTDKANNIGIAAHITAAASGGPRYDDKITVDQRTSIDNAVWLCSNCATKVDRDADRYSVTLLKEWKKKAEEHAHEEFGKPPLSRQEYSVLKDLAFGTIKRRRLPEAVSRVCNMTETEMEKLDPRFSVDVEYKTGAIFYTLNAREPVTMSLTIESHFGDEFERKYSDLVNHGRDLEIDAKAVKFKGSPLFEFEEIAKGKLTFSTHARKSAVLKCTFEAKDQTRQLDDIHGELVGGVESVTFNGKTCGGIITFVQTCLRTSGMQKNCKVDTTINFECWSGHSLRSLPYFNKTYEFYEAILHQEKMLTNIEIDGTTKISAKGYLNANNLEYKKYYRLLRHIRNVRKILELLGLDVDFDRSIVSSEEEILFVEKIYQLLFSQAGLKGRKIASATMTMKISNNASESEIIKISTIPHVIRYVHEYEMTLNLWGRKIVRPRIAMTYTMAMLIKLGPKVKITVGKTYRFKVCPSNECQFFADFIL